MLYCVLSRDLKSGSLILQAAGSWQRYRKCGKRQIFDRFLICFSARAPGQPRSTRPTSSISTRERTKFADFQLHFCEFLTSHFFLLVLPNNYHKLELFFNTLKYEYNCLKPLSKNHIEQEAEQGNTFNHYCFSLFTYIGHFYFLCFSILH